MPPAVQCRTAASNHRRPQRRWQQLPVPRGYGQHARAGPSLLLPGPALEALVFKPVVDQIMREAKEMLQDALRTDKPADKVR